MLLIAAVLIVPTLLVAWWSRRASAGRWIAPLLVAAWVATVLWVPYAIFRAWDNTEVEASTRIDTLNAGIASASACITMDIALLLVASIWIGATTLRRRAS